MFGSKYVLYVSRRKIKAFKVSGGVFPKIKKGLQSSWNESNLEDVIKLFNEKLKMKDVRLLLDDDLSYVMQLSLPTKVEKSNERKAVFEKFSAQVPDELLDTDWDYKVLGSSGPEIEVFAFAPVKHIFELISQALDENNISIEAVEPVLVASTRDKNPVIGIALKKDIEGDDTQVLNLQHKSVGEQGKKEDNIEKKNNSNGLKRLLVVLLLVAVAGGGVVYTLLAKRSQSSVQLAPEPTVVVEASPSPTGMETATPAPSVLPRSEYAINILNGTGVPGDASIAQEALESAGFTNITTGNAEVFDYDLTEVGMREDVPEAIMNAIREALAEQYELAENYILTQDSDYAVVIITGTNKTN